MAYSFLGLGDNVVDKYMDTQTLYPGGQAMNFAAYTKMLGQKSAYLGVFGNDENAEYVKSIANELGVSLENCPTKEGENGYACISHKDGDRIFLYSNKGGVAGENPLVLGEKELEYCKGFSLIHTSANGRVDKELHKIKALNIPLSYDFSVRFSLELLEKICPYLTFAVISCGHLTEDETKKAMKLAHKCGAEKVIATRGEQGSYFFDGEEIYFCETNEVKPVDTLGAGDSYLAAFMVSYIPYYLENIANPQPHPSAIEKAMKNGSEFAAKNVMFKGAFGYGKKFEIE